MDKLDSQIKKLKDELMEKDKKIEKLNKNIQSEHSWLKKLFWPIVIVVLSVMFFNKLSNAENQLELKDQHIDKLKNELKLIDPKMNKLNNELKLKDQQIDKLKKELELMDPKMNKLNEELKLKDQHIDKLTKDLELMDPKMNKLNEELELKNQNVDKLTKELELMIKVNNELRLKVPEINKLKEESKLKDEEINRLMNDLKLKDPKIDSLTKDVDLKDEEIDDLTQKLELKTEEYDKLLKSSYMVSLFVGAREGSPEIFYSANEEKANLIISVAKEALAENIASCYRTNPEFDVYRSCFRDLSVFFHNKLEKKFGPQWIVTTGRVAYCFMITTIDSEKEEYFFKIGDIYFEVFNYKDDVRSQHNVEETSIDYEEDENVANVSTVENIVIETESEKISDVPQQVEEKNVVNDQKIEELEKISDVPQKVEEKNVVKDRKIEESENVQREEKKKIN